MTNDSVNAEHGVRMACDQGVAVITLCDPQRLNPLGVETQERLRYLLSMVQSDSRIRSVLITGEGRGFCVGADLASIEFVAGGASQGSLGNRAAKVMRDVSAPLIRDIRRLPVPVVAAINGPCVGAGVGLALAADVVLMGHAGYFCLPFVPKLGLIPDLGTTWLLQRLVGRGRATAMTLLGERISAQDAVHYGLAWRAVGDAELRGEALRTAQRLGSLPSHGVVETRRAYDAAESNTLDAQLDYEADRQQVLFDLPSFEEGLAEFQRRRERKSSDPQRGG